MTLPDFTPAQWLATTLLWSVLMVLLGTLSQAPAVSVTPPGNTVLKLMIRYSGKRLGDCRTLDDSELARLPPNMRQASLCPPEKSPLYAELQIDEQMLYRNTITPSGVHNDGVLAEYREITVPAGLTRITLRIRDHSGAPDFTHVLDRLITIEDGHIVTIQFTDRGFDVGGAT